MTSKSDGTIHIDLTGSNVDAPKTALKADSGKPDMSHIYGGFLAEVARAMEYGAKKYKRGDYLNGHKATQIVSALLRHTFAWLWGEETDPESGVSHLGHMGANIMMLVHQRDVGTLKDDRVKR